MEKYGFGKDVFGFTAGYYITISTERLDDVMQVGHQTYDKILGLAVAHEIGHVLLGNNSHTSRGTMSPRWCSKDFQMESRHSAGFTEEQIDRMHRNWAAAQEAERHGRTAQTALDPER